MAAARTRADRRPGENAFGPCRLTQAGRASNNRRMQSAFGYVVFGAVALSLVMSLLFLIGGNSAYEQIGEGGLEREGEGRGRGGGRGRGRGGSGGRGELAPEPALAQPFPQRPSLPDHVLSKSPEALRAERETEIRQMLQARSARRVGRGEEPLDVDAEVAALLAEQPAAPSAHDAGIAEEVLQLVVARNERRERQGLEPLDIEAEVARTLAELSP